MSSGCKRVGSSSTYDDKYGFTLTVTMDMGESQILNPLIIFSGQFWDHIMKQWSSYENILVLFTKNHWQTSFTIVTYFEYLRKSVYPSKK